MIVAGATCIGLGVKCSGSLKAGQGRIDHGDSDEISLLSPVAVVGGFANQLSAPEQAEQSAKISMKQARSVATAKAPSKIKSSELEKEHGKLVYSFDIDTLAGICEIQVDAYSGAMVSDQI